MLRLTDEQPWDQTMVNDLFTDDHIVIVYGKGEDVDRINLELQRLEYAVVLVMSDEESEFPHERLSHPKIKVWVQYPQREADRYLPGGYSPGTRSVEPATKTLDWFFSGQITHLAREEMAQALRQINGGLLIETKGFTQGLTHEDYLEVMARTKIVPCPHGAVTPDTLRCWEALELGCMPVIHDRDRAFYEKILGELPFPSVSNWSDIKHLPYHDCTDWWTEYKQNLINNMTEDLEWLKHL